jgi:glycerol uptake facilitator-like aquaporin
MLKQKLNRLGAMTGAAFTLGMVTSGEAFANKNFNDIATNITAGIASIPGFLTAVSYMMGLLFAVLGILKVKDHVENPSQTALKDGAIRLAVGGGLFALPIITQAMQDLVNDGTTGAIDANKLNKIKMSTN